MKQVKQWGKRYLPTALTSRIRKLLPGSIKFHGPYKTWKAAEAACQGYDNADILAGVLEANLKVKRGEAAFERDGVVFQTLALNHFVLEQMQAVAKGSQLHVLDFGGSLGSTYFQHQKALASIDTLSWHVVEQTHFVAAGQANLEDANLKFFETIAEACAVQKPDFILLSSVLQYLPNPLAVLQELSEMQAPYLCIDRTPFVRSGESQIMVQTVPKSINEGSYPLWALSEAEVMAALTGYQKRASIVNEEGSFLVHGCAFSFEGLALEINKAN
jgi:putative methyltransferase (TIGR04325 family)